MYLSGGFDIENQWYRHVFRTWWPNSLVNNSDSPGSRIGNNQAQEKVEHLLGQRACDFRPSQNISLKLTSRRNFDPVHISNRQTGYLRRMSHRNVASPQFGGLLDKRVPVVIRPKPAQAETVEPCLCDQQFRGRIENVPIRPVCRDCDPWRAPLLQFYTRLDGTPFYAIGEPILKANCEIGQLFQRDGCRQFHTNVDHGLGYGRFRQRWKCVCEIKSHAAMTKPQEYHRTQAPWSILSTVPMRFFTLHAGEAYNVPCEQPEWL